MDQRILHSLRANLKNVLELSFDSSKLWVGLKGCLNRGVSSFRGQNRRCTTVDIKNYMMKYTTKVVATKRIQK